MPLFTCPADGQLRIRVQPENLDVALTGFLGVAGVTSIGREGMLYRDSAVRLGDVTDGTSHPLFVGERPPNAERRFGWWYAGVGQDGSGSADCFLGVADYRSPQSYRIPTCPYGPYRFGPGDIDNVCDIFRFWSRHNGGGHFLLADGAVRFFPYSAAPLLPALATRAGNDPTELP